MMMSSRPSCHGDDDEDDGFGAAADDETEVDVDAADWICFWTSPLSDAEVNHRPVFAVGPEQIRQAFEAGFRV